MFTSCSKRPENIDWNKLKLEYSYSKDQSKLQSLEFLENRISSLKSQYITLINPESNSIIKLTELSKMNVSKDSILKLIHKTWFRVITNYVPDNEILNTQEIKDIIDEVYHINSSVPWRRDVPMDIFNEFLLSYKVGWEYPEHWREEIAPIFKVDFENWRDTSKLQYLDTFKTAYIDSFVNKIVISKQDKYYSYSTNEIKIGDFPSYSNLKITKSGDCLSEALIDNYLLKAAGIPASYDIIPYWGSANGMHATAVYYNPGQKRMRLLTGLLYYPAKVFRRTFSYINEWTDRIKPSFGNQQFAIPFLKSDQLIDVTSEHTTTVDLKIPIKNDQRSKIAYITVFNYGQWVPIFWAKIKDGHATFENMGYNMIYRVAVPDQDNTLVYENPIYLSLKKQIFLPRIFQQKIDIDVAAINQGKKSLIIKGNTYILFLLSTSGELIPFRRQDAVSNGTIKFKKINLSSFYMVADVNDKRNLARFFSIKNGKQIWH